MLDFPQDQYGPVGSRVVGVTRQTTWCLKRKIMREGPRIEGGWPSAAIGFKGGRWRKVLLPHLNLLTPGSSSSRNHGHSRLAKAFRPFYSRFPSPVGRQSNWPAAQNAVRRFDPINASSFARPDRAHAISGIVG